ncbi:MAG: hypothetical protein HQ570_04605, partial [Candidatus Omnitrophica bacterium]|nr:hypothetical protein [Candidatus Omnitrophota bacterium]
GKIEKFKEGGKEVFFAGTKKFVVSLNEERSFYNKYGEFFPFICAVFLLGVFIRKRRKFKAVSSRLKTPLML